MIIHNVSVTFSDGSSSRVKDCDVEFGVELLREVDENLDNTLSEAFASVAARQTMTIDKLLLTLAETLWFANNFLTSASKTLKIDGTTFAVVGADDSVKFPLWKDRNVYSTPTLKFKVKSPGVELGGILTDQDGTIIVDQDGNVIKFQEE